MKFEDLRLIEPLLQAVRAEGYETPTPIQELAIPHLLEGKDIFGCAQTGTGKTAAFALPTLQKLRHYAALSKISKPNAKGGRCEPTRPIRALILTPTRELAAQVDENFRVYGRHIGLRHAVIFGGVPQGRQVQALKKGVDVLVATPGRLLDLMNQRILHLGSVEIFVLDEADRMLDMGFIHDIRKVVKVLPQKRQTLMFSATMPKDIRKLADTILHNPVTVSTTPEVSTAAETVTQSLFFVDMAGKTKLLERHIKGSNVKRALVFTRTKHRANKVTQCLNRSEISAEAFHSNKSQNTRIRVLEKFKKGSVRVLVASDIAARGIDVDDISHVFNYDLPNVAETYVHRIGRTGRAGASGEAISFCSDDEHGALRDIERLLGGPIPVQGKMPRPAAVEHQPKNSTPRGKKASTQISKPRRKTAASAESTNTNNKFRRRRRRPQGSTSGPGKQNNRRKGRVR
jgi:ATP-dependent RNA helicase RhlE